VEDGTCKQVNSHRAAVPTRRVKSRYWCSTLHSKWPTISWRSHVVDKH